METRSRIGEYGWEPQYYLDCKGLTKEKKAQALQIIDKYYQPMPAQEIVKLIARLQIIAPEKEKSNVDMRARTAIWVEELSAYPADVVQKALKARYRWFPSLAEVLEKCANEVAYRNLIKQGIRCYRIDNE